MNAKKLIALSCVCAAGALAAADATPIMVSLITPAQFPSRHYDVTGLRISVLYGECRDFMGLDIGLANQSAEDFYGLGIGGVNIARKQLCGGQFGLFNWDGGRAREWSLRSIGAQMGGLNCADTLCGFQSGLLNMASSDIVGMQMGLINVANDLDGVQFGLCLILGFNVAGGSVRGSQIGLINYAGRMERGLQIGLINISSRHGWLPVIPIVNGRF